MSNAAADDVVEEVWTPKAAAAAKQEARQPKSGKFAALASGIPILGAKSDDNLQPCPPPPPPYLCYSCSLSCSLQVRNHTAKR
jgi:hypothetical protein